MSVVRLLGMWVVLAVLASGSVWGSEPDVHSNARPSEVRVTRVDLDLTVDFSRKILFGSTELAVARQPGVGADVPLLLDTKGLEIVRVESAGAGEAHSLPFRLGADDPILGRPLSIDLNGASAVRVVYRTTGRATALQWLDPAGTAGKKHPFLFTQSEAIHARSWIPLQDSPGVRVTYKATIRVPTGLTAVMSADKVDGKGEAGVFRFEMKETIPSYLIALAVGDLKFQAIGKRTGVYAEPSVVEAAAWEFVDTEKMVEAVEARFGPYRWGRYDILVLPPSFPFGGMENPKLTFATPTVLAGDRSLVALIAHELSHSWSGNLVTNATWRDFWLNEGFTTYLERRVVEDLFGPDRAAMERALGWDELQKELTTFPKRDQILHVDLNGRDPDEGMTHVPYEKGALFLTRIEEAVGRPKFDAYLRGYFDRNAFHSITTADFVRDLQTHLLDDARTLDLTAWLDEPGLPGDAPKPSSKRFAAVDAAALAWSGGKTSAADLRTADWSTFEWVHFLHALPDRIESERLAELDKALGLTTRGNAEVLQAWLVVTTRNQYEPADERLASFLTTVGRRKYLMPLYTELLKTPEGQKRARAIYEKARPFYHPIARESVDKLLGATSK